MNRKFVVLVLQAALFLNAMVSIAQETRSLKSFIQPALKSGGFSMDDYILWCPSVIKVGKTYHMFASRWPAVYGLEGWTTYSEIVRATSTSLTGPYTFQEVVIQKREGFWDNDRAHNPRIVKIGKQFVLYYISSANETGYATSMSIEGPWTRSGKVAMPFSNPAPFVKPDGSLYVFGRKAVDKKRIAQAYSATAVDSSYTLLNEGKNLLPNDATLEDPTIWWGANGYNILCSDFGGILTSTKKAGAQYFSTDGLNFNAVTSEPIYEKTVLFDDKSTETFSRRERPFVFVDDKGKLQALFTACLPKDGPARIIVNPIKNY